MSMPRHPLLRFSKPSVDIRTEEADRRQADEAMAARYRRIALALMSCPPRESCLLCGAGLSAAATFDHHSVAYRLCAHCGHIQSARIPPPGFPSSGQEGIGFSEIYPDLDDAAYRSRVDRVYRPKLDWVVEALSQIGYTDERLRTSRWLELGCGAGCFLAALTQAGFNHVHGLEREPRLVDMANRRVGRSVAEHFSGSMEAALDRYPADILAAFYVWEHLDPLQGFLARLRRLPPGTIVVLAVPVFGFTTVLERVCADRFPRQLSGVIHTQLFTRRSLETALALAGLSVQAEWIFGQDSLDLSRMLQSGLGDSLPAELSEEASDRMGDLIDPLQQAIDQARFSDSRHIIAVRS